MNLYILTNILYTERDIDICVYIYPTSPSLSKNIKKNRQRHCLIVGFQFLAVAQRMGKHRLWPGGWSLDHPVWGRAYEKIIYLYHIIKLQK